MRAVKSCRSNVLQGVRSSSVRGIKFHSNLTYIWWKFRNLTHTLNFLKKFYIHFWIFFVQFRKILEFFSLEYFLKSIEFSVVLIPWLINSAVIKSFSNSVSMETNFSCFDWQNASASVHERWEIPTNALITMSFVFFAVSYVNSRKAMASVRQ